ncbi:MAG: hypothetical protein PHX77_01310 [Candidatus Bipolaricaulis sp.]|nr:hypothetical protein [Candidatus Bipolaricaulis sp.]MDD5646073.1 hypothetical protein [Candidatus Bipolaricaulis sp.]
MRFFVLCAAMLAAFAFDGSVFASRGGRPGGIPTDPPALLVQGDPGRTSLFASFSGHGAQLVLSRSVGERLDVAAVVTSDRPFDVRLRTLWVRDLPPLRVEAELGSDGILLLGSLHLGPVRVEIGRSWGDGARGWGLVRFAPRMDVACFVGVSAAGGSVRPLAGVSWRPYRRALWNVAVRLDGTGVQIAVGGVG